jgi:uncharacterized protein
MIVGILEVALTFYAFSLKDKRGIVRRIIQRTKTAFNAAVAEVDELDNPGATVLGIVTVGNEHRFVESRLDKIENFIEELELAEITDSRKTVTYP